MSNEPEPIIYDDAEMFTETSTTTVPLEPAERGPSVTVNPATAHEREGECYTPTETIPNAEWVSGGDGTTQWGILPCGRPAPVVATEAVEVQLPATGVEDVATFGIGAVVLVVVGAILVGLRRA